MDRAIQPGDWVFVTEHRFIAGRLARVRAVRGDGLNPCSCCGMGVALSLGDPNVTYGASPAQLRKLDRAPRAPRAPYVFS